MSRGKILNTPAIRRMPTYLHKLLKMRLEGKVNVSSTELAEYMNIELIVVRKDIALTGISGQRRVGYDINELIRYIKNYLATNYNVKTGKIYGKNCYGEAKVEEFKRVYPKATLEAFYSDSLSDLPMMRLADKAYLVKGEEVKEIDTNDYENA